MLQRTMSLKEIMTPRSAHKSSSSDDGDNETLGVVYYPNEEANEEGPKVVSPRLNSLAKKVDCARDYAARLALLIHARSCSGACSIEHCAIARGVLRHCQECFSIQNCHPSCRQAKILLRHYRVCRRKNATRPCLVCSILKRDYSWYLLSDARQKKFRAKAKQARSPISAATSSPSVQSFLKPLNVHPPSIEQKSVA